LPYHEQASRHTQENFHEKYIDDAKQKQKVQHGDFDVPIKFKLLCRSDNKDSDRFLISVGTHKADKLKIAIANVNVNEVWNLKNSLSHNVRNRKSSRYRFHLSESKVDLFDSFVNDFSLMTVFFRSRAGTLRRQRR